MEHRTWTHVALAAALLPAFGHAELTRLDTDFVPGDRYVNPGDILTVTANGDAGLSLEYRFVLQQHTGTTWVTISNGPWEATNLLTLDAAAAELAHGTYRVISMVREAGTPTDFLLNYQTFAYGPTTTDLCSYLNGKVFINDAPTTTTVNLGTLSLGDALAALGSPGIPLNLASHAHAIAAIAFSGDTVTVLPDSTVDIVAVVTTPFPVPIAMSATFDAGLTGTYSCNDNVVTVSAQGMTTNVTAGGALPFTPGTVYVQSAGTGTVDAVAGTLASGGTTFRLPGSTEPDATVEPGDDAGGALHLLPLIGLLAWRRRGARAARA